MSNEDKKDETVETTETDSEETALEVTSEDSIKKDTQTEDVNPEPETAPEEIVGAISKEATPAEEASTEEPVAETTNDAPAEEDLKTFPFREFRPGMTVRVHERILDVSPKGEKRERTQVFEGIILKMKGGEDRRTMTVRKVSKGVGVEKIFPLSSPNLQKIELVKTAKTRRANLSFLKGRFRRKLKETWNK